MEKMIANQLQVPVDCDLSNPVLDDIKPTKDDSYLVYVGTYAKPDQESIFLCKLNPSTGELTKVSGFKAGENPSFLTLDQEKKYLYAVLETAEFQGQQSGGVASYSIDKKTGGLTLINQQPSLGTAPCHITVDKANRFALLANYHSGSFSVFPIQSDGALAYASDHKQDQGKSINPDRQEGPHAHYVQTDEHNRYAFAIDLGTDMMMTYAFDSLNGTLTLANAYISKAGAGPRHLAFHPNGQYAYLIHELDNTITTLAYQSSKGTFIELQTISTLPEDYKGENGCAAVKVSPNGKFLYGSNRGHNSIAVFAIDEGTGKLAAVDYFTAGVNGPRDFTIDPTGNHLLVGSQKANTIISLRIDPKSGKLTSTGFQVQVQAPTCIQIVSDFTQ